MTDWVVVRERYGFTAMRLVKRTGKQVVAVPESGWGARRERHLSLSQIVATLPEVRAKAMTERLVSSQALEMEDQRNATQRHHDRIERIKAEFAE
ncbi:MAG: hypothetical protein EOO12_00075 [Chitinophagaceae bacterium]|nr:MAG: hypothetical protein EOO12_00075 [Chitinophagaceae bacterium]